MGLFKFLKKEKKEMPKFPRLPARLPQLPRYESPLKEIGPRIPEKVLEPFKIPVRVPTLKPATFPSKPPAPEEPERAVKEPVYVKLSKYRQAVKLIKEINTKLAESEKILAQLTDIKNKQDAEIAKWQEEITSIKNKLMEVDKNLFEA